MTALPMTLMSDDEVARYGRPSEAGFGALQTARGLLPLVAMEIDARVAGVIAAIEVAQTFVNTTGTPIEATYIFPLPDRAAVHAFRMEVAGRVIDGVVEERGAAREQYDEAIAKGHRAAITEEERPGVFTLRVGNLMPGESATVRLSLVGPLPVDDGEVTFRFPLVVAPRYMPGSALGGDQSGLGTAGDTNLVPDASRISPPVLLPGCPNPVRLGLRVQLEDHDIKDVASSLHAVTTAKRDAQVIEVHPGERLDRDFILRWRIDGSALRSSLVCADDPDGRAGTFMLTLVPPSTLAVAAKPRDIVFVIDRSGSMGGWKMVAARRAAARMIDTLTSRDRFCAIAFDDSVELLPELQLVDATDRNRYRAVELLAKVDARGGTELESPLQQAAAMLTGSYDDRERVIVLVTDGQVGNEDAILRTLGPSLRNIRVFTLGIDQAVNAAFLRRLAGAGGGLCELVESEDRLDAVMAKVHRRIGTPIATELALRGSQLDIEYASVAPKKLPDVYAGAPVTILGRYRNAAAAGGTIEIDGTSFGDPLRMRIAREPDTSPAAWLSASWARAAIRDREDRYATGERGGLEHEIVAISKRHSVLSRFTAFLAVDRSQIVNAGGHLDQIVQAVETPAGWESTGGAAPDAKRQLRGRAAPPKAPSPGPMRNAPMRSAAPQSKSMMPAAMPAMPTNARAPGSLARPAPPTPPAAAAPPHLDASAGAPPLGGMRGGYDRKEAEERLASREIASPADDFCSDEDAPRDLGRGEKQKDAAAAPMGSPYLVKLAALARELEAQGRGRADGAAIRLLRQRLTEWVEDLRSVGGQQELAAAVEQLVQRLSAALALATDLATEAVAVAAELARLAAGQSPPRSKGRVAFWK
ncbi:MAG: VIT domain-containing protein [Kofleriaceae bacterium]